MKKNVCAHKKVCCLFLFMFVLLLGFLLLLSAFKILGLFMVFNSKVCFLLLFCFFFAKLHVHITFFIRFISCILLLTLKLTLFCCYGRGSWLLIAEGPFLFFWFLVRLKTARCSSFVFFSNTLIEPLINACHVLERGHGSDKGESFGGRV